MWSYSPTAPSSPWHHGPSNAKGILESWLLGQSGGPALADVLFGKVSPSGKLAQTIPFDINDDPSTINWPGEEGHVDYGEGVFVGYRYYDTYNKAVDYPFGFGLSYATFEVSDVKAVKTGACTATRQRSGQEHLRTLTPPKPCRCTWLPARLTWPARSTSSKASKKVFLKAGESAEDLLRSRRSRLRLLV